MNHSKRANPAALSMGILGLAGLLLRRLLYALGTDSRGLLVSLHPLSLALAGLALGTAVYLILALRRQTPPARYEDSFPPSKKDLLGHCLAGVGIGATVLTNPLPMDGRLGTAWQLLGLACVPCLLYAGLCRGKGRRPFFLAHVAVCLFFMIHMVAHYQTWSSDPQLQDYLYPMLGVMGLMLFSFYTAGLDVGCGSWRMQRGAGLGACFCCLVALAQCEYPLMYLGCGVWALRGAGLPARGGASGGDGQ